MSDKKDEQEDVIVNAVDDLSDVAHSEDRARRLSDYESTNVPLSKAEIEQDEARDPSHEGWAPRTTENIGDLTPIPERPARP